MGIPQNGETSDRLTPLDHNNYIWPTLSENGQGLRMNAQR